MRRILASFIALSLVLVMVPAQAKASGLTDAQMQAILSLLSSFGADSSTIANVNASLHGQIPNTAPTPLSSIFTTTQPTATIDQSSLMSSTSSPTLTGTASNIHNSFANDIEVDYKGAGGNGGGYAQVTNGRWQWPPYGGISLSAGTYAVQIVDPGTRTVLTTGTLNVNTNSNTASTTTIAVTYPQTGNSLDNSGAKSGGKIATILWNEKNGNYPVNIWLLNQNGQIIKAIAYSAPNTGSYVWAYDPSLAAGTYEIQINALYPSGKSGQASAQSGFFTLTQSSVVINSPAPTCTLSANPNVVASSIATILSWRSTGATSAKWVTNTSGKDSIPSPSGTPSTNGSVSFTPTLVLPPGTSQVPFVTLQVSGPGGTATCMAYITVLSSEHAAFDNTVFTQTISHPVISGTASGVSQVGVVLSNSGGKVYGSGLIPVVNGHWSVTVSPALAAGSYFVNVYDAGNNGLVNGGSINVAGSATSQAATIDQSSVSASSNMFTISGTALNASSVFVALVKSDYSGAKEWNTIYANHSYVAFTGDSVIRVSGNRWSATFSGVSSGTYTVLVYDNSANAAAQSLLGSGVLSVSAQNSFSFVAGSGTPITIGVGQNMTDGQLKITLTSIYYSGGLTGTPMANFQIDGTGLNSNHYTAAIGGTIPDGGVGDSLSPGGGISVSVAGISVPMNTATVLVHVVSKG